MNTPPPEPTVERETTEPVVKIDVSHIVTEDDTPVDNWFSEKQQRFLVRLLYASYKRERPFVAGADIGIFATPYTPPIVPDVLVSLDAEIADDWYAKENRSYFLWEFGKPPEVVVEIVSNKKGGEIGRKLTRYAQLHVLYYVVFDPQKLIQDEPVAVYELNGLAYQKRDDLRLNWLDLGLTLWDGSYEGKPATYLRWTDENDELLLSDEELLELQGEQLDQAEAQREEAEAQRDEAEARAARLARKLRELGIDPDDV